MKGNIIPIALAMKAMHMAETEQPGPKGDSGPSGPSGPAGPAGPKGDPGMAYFGVNLSTAKAFILNGVTTSGLSTFYLTKDGTAAGEAIFSKRPMVFVAAESNVTTPQDVPTASVKSLSSDFKTLVTQVIKGDSVTLLGLASLTTAKYAPNGTRVNVFVIGE